MCPPGLQHDIAEDPYYRRSFPDGTPWARFYRTEAGFLLRFPDRADFCVSRDGGQVACTPTPGALQEVAEHIYLNQVLPLALSKRGELVFHASSVEIADGAIAFAAATGWGKSTLAGAFAVRGHRFLGDDGLLLKPAQDDYLVQPAHPSLRLWNDSETTLLQGATRKSAALDYTTKSRLLADTQLVHCDESRPLRAIYVLGDGTRDDIAIERLKPAAAVLEWTRHAFLLDVDDAEANGALFARIATLSAAIACYRLDYPRRFEKLDSVVEAVTAHATGRRSSA
jgi:hypothetical protein